jgi:hypothetical protein
MYVLLYYLVKLYKSFWNHGKVYFHNIDKYFFAWTSFFTLEINCNMAYDVMLVVYLSKIPNKYL